jgi:hypothetical protein
MKGRTTLILLACIALLAAVIWIQDVWISDKAGGQARIIRLFDFDSESLLTLEFNRGEQTVKLRKENGVWLAGSSSENFGQGDDQLIQQMIAGLSSMGRGTVITPEHLEIRGLDVAEYGFDQPTLTIIAVDDRGLRKWLVGRVTPLGDMVYVMEAGYDNIYTVSEQLLHILPSDSAELRNRVLFPGDAARVKRIEIRGPAGFAQLLKDSRVGWQLHQPVSAKADDKAVLQFLEDLYRLRIEGFVADNVSDFSVYGLQDEVRQISLAGGDGVSRMVIVGDEVPGQPGLVYARRADQPSVYTLRADLLRFIDQPSERFRDAAVLNLPKNSITSVHITHGVDEITLQWDPAGHWEIVKPVLWSADSREVTRLIDLWFDTVITQFDLAGEASEAEWVFEFGSSSLQTTNTIEVLAMNGRRDGLLIRRNHTTSLYQINLPELPASMGKPLTYKDKRIWDLTSGDISRIEIIKDHKIKQAVERQGDHTFSPVATNGTVQVDAAACERLLEQLSTLKVNSHIAYNPRDLGIYGLENPEIEIYVGLTATNELGRILLIGHETADGFYSMVKGRDVVFYLSKDEVEKLSADILVPLQSPPTAQE